MISRFHDFGRIAASELCVTNARNRYDDMTDRKFAILKPPSAHLWSSKSARKSPQKLRQPDGVGEMPRGKASL